MGKCCSSNGHLRLAPKASQSHAKGAVCKNWSTVGYPSHLSVSNKENKHISQDVELQSKSISNEKKKYNKDREA